ncbi:LTA synthase family protein [Flavobacterium sp. JP2137]|uniref:LTA synthase family protein n=1 Tax=Flavobacterium sp. JP2137 TaxID=3414510 RepID=UPI003D2FB4AB
MLLNFSLFKPFKYLLMYYLALNIALRSIFIFHPITTSSFTFLEICRIYSIGALNDFFIFICGYAFFGLYYLFLSNGKYARPWGPLIFGILLAFLIYISFFNTIFNDYGGSVPEIVQAFLAIKVVCFGLCLFFPSRRTAIRKAIYFSSLFLFSLLLVQNAISEYFFWNEFGLRFNFIAVDYLVYTNTVIGNILESYPVVPLFTTIGVLTLLLTIFIYKKTHKNLEQLMDFSSKVVAVFLYAILFTAALFTLPKLSQLENAPNVFTNEIQANGTYKFYQAFNQSELDYFQFFPVLPQQKMVALLRKDYPAYNGNSLLRSIHSDSTALKKNVVLLTIESLSADFMAYYGNEKQLTPFLDSLALQSLFFTNTYATGNRTVRGLEAVTLSIPPSPGESVVKRKDNKNKFSTATVFQKQGYQTKYLYGGDAYFDNMEEFFSNNHFDIVDKSDFKDDEITFKNIWGVCDEDMYTKAIQVMNSEYRSGVPFFNHIMTVSNHRPYTYPAGKIDIDPSSKSRDGGVKYTDYALRQFFKQARKQAWFDQTVFVIVSDHCASSAGKTELPLDKYRIPAMIYAPNFIAPQQYNTLMSQIDLMPTLLGLLRFNYTSKFYGQDVLQPSYSPRAFIATYQDMGYIKDNTLTILSPTKKVRQYSFQSQKPQEVKAALIQISNINQLQVDLATAYYQSLAQQLQSKQYQELP